MDEPFPPTARQLGISDVEYERIVRDVRLRRGDQPPPVPDVARRRSKKAPLAILVLLAVVALVSGLGKSSSKPAYAFLDSSGGRPVTYSSCHPVQVAIYPAGGPPDAEKLVREAVDQMRSATGLDIRVTGVFGGYAPNWNFKAAPSGPDDPISVSWQDGAAIAELTDHIAGLGGSRKFTSSNGTEHLGAGTIALSRSFYASLTQQGDHAEALAVLLHEFGHVFGLDHVKSSHELMYDRNVGQTYLGPGDLEGLRLLGQGPCV